MDDGGDAPGGGGGGGRGKVTGTPFARGSVGRALAAASGPASPVATGDTDESDLEMAVVPGSSSAGAASGPWLPPAKAVSAVPTSSHKANKVRATFVAARFATAPWHDPSSAAGSASGSAAASAGAGSHQTRPANKVRSASVGAGRPPAPTTPRIPPRPPTAAPSEEAAAPAAAAAASAVAGEFEWGSLDGPLPFAGAASAASAAGSASAAPSASAASAWYSSGWSSSKFVLGRRRDAELRVDCAV